MVSVVVLDRYPAGLDQGAIRLACEHAFILPRAKTSFLASGLDLVQVWSLGGADVDAFVEIATQQRLQRREPTPTGASCNCWEILNVLWDDCGQSQEPIRGLTARRTEGLGEVMATEEWARIDLNLLLPLDALLLERSVTKAAERLAVGQPTMSVSLAKLRRYFDDPLLVREGRGLVLTPFAESLQQPVETALLAATEALTAGSTFDPGSVKRTFTVIASDYATTLLLHPLMFDLPQTAPGVRLAIESLRPDRIESLRLRRCDLVFWPLQLATEELLNYPHLLAFTDEFVTVADEARAPDHEPLSAEEIAAHPAVLVKVPDLAIPDVRPSEQGFRQNGAITVDSLGLALQTVARTNLITVVPRRLFEHMGPSLGLREVPTTADMPKLSVAMFWHPRNSCVPAQKWLRDRISEIGGKL
ncbi:LysR family transcriptional regulator [Kribbella antibiotica]|uniref:LysR family transcriptional regulator n=1 Tax=Kribbella antibiotica TaxID=190195 RepID=A0A4R4ZLT4_9ACTN|nr:LysR family transcriptional regulator [Kribbella antibiotica]TDD58844.1 LysR family transcriptional regulator [Kribbella antibiotica]